MEDLLDGVTYSVLEKNLNRGVPTGDRVTGLCGLVRASLH